MLLVCAIISSIHVLYVLKNEHVSVLFHQYFTVLQTANFKQDGHAQLNTLKQIQPSKPAMVMEFWTGWFDHWDEPIHNTWDPVGKYLRVSMRNVILLHKTNIIICLTVTYFFTIMLQQN